VIITTPTPFQQAIAVAQQKGLLPSTLSSAQLSRLESQLKRRAVFSARMNSASVLSVLQKNLEQIVSGMGIESESGRLRSIPEAKAQLKEAMFAAGVRIAPVGTPKINDFYSDARRELMVRTTVLDTLGFGRHVAGQDQVALDVNPAWELIRMVEPKGGDAAKRPWHERWKAAMDDIGSDADGGCTDPDEDDGRMVALKNHPIWQALGDGAGGYDDSLGNPWPPFAFNSGMNVIDVPRRECAALGIMNENERVEPDTSFDMNENLEASVTKFDAAMQKALNGGGLKVVKGILKIANSHRYRRASMIRAKVKGLCKLREAA